VAAESLPDTHGHAKGEHPPYASERPIPYTARMLFLWFAHAARRGYPRHMMVTDHLNYVAPDDPAAVATFREALRLAKAGDVRGAAALAGVSERHAQDVAAGLAAGMRFAVGCEVDDDPRTMPGALDVVKAMQPDGIVRSVHFLTIDHPHHGPKWAWPFDNPEFAATFDLVGADAAWAQYVPALLSAVAEWPGCIVGHFYVPAKFGHWPAPQTLDAYEDALVDACRTHGSAIELNTRFLYRCDDESAAERYREAHRRLLRKAKAAGVGVAIGSDAHSPADQGRAFDIAIRLLADAKIDAAAFPGDGSLFLLPIA